MKYIKEYSKFKSDKINEEFIGGALKNLFGFLKNKISTKYSKMFGSAKKADNIIEAYKKERMSIEEEKNASSKAVAQYLKDVSSGAQVDEGKKKNLETQLQKSLGIYKQKLDLVKKKFDLRLDEIIKKEKNEKIKNYINLKKIELEQELLANELKMVQGDMGLTDDVIKNSKVFADYVKKMTEKSDQSKKAAEDQEKILSEKSSNSFNMEEAKKNKEYLWTDSDFSKGVYKFKLGEEIIVFVRNSGDSNISTLEKEKDDYKGTSAFVFPRIEGDDPNSLRIGYDKNNKEKTFTINKGKVITTKLKQDEKKSEEEKKSTEDK